MNSMMRKLVGYVGLFMSLALASQAGTSTWTNGVGDATGKWSNTGNWVGGSTPLVNDMLVFGASTATSELNNDLGNSYSWSAGSLTGQVNFRASGITFNSDAPAYMITSTNRFTLDGSIILNSADTITQTISNLTATVGVTVSGAGNLALGGYDRISTWTAPLKMNGTGVLTLYGPLGVNHNGGITVNSGTVMMSKTVANTVNTAVTINNGGKIMIGASVNQMNSTLTMAPGATYDLNGFDSGSVGLSGLGGTIVNDAAGVGTNTLQLNCGANSSFGGTIKNGATAKIALSVGNSSSSTLFQLFSGTNTFSGGTKFDQTSTGTSTLSISGMHNIGAAGSRNLMFNGTGASYLQINGTGITDLSGFDSVTFNTGKRVGLDIADPSNTFTISQALTNGASGVFAKRGAGTLVLTNAATYTGATYLNGGTLTVNYDAGGSLSTTAPSFANGATLKLLGKTSSATAQTLGNLSANAAGGGNLLIDPNGNNFTLTLGTLTLSGTAGGSVLMGKALNAGSGTAAITTTTGTLNNGIYSTRAIFANGIADTGYDFATTASGGPTYTVSGYTGAVLLPPSVGSGTTNYKMTGSTNLTANVAAYTLKMEAGDLALGANTLTVVGLLATGTGAMQITGDPGVTGITASGTELLVHQYNSAGLTIGAVIGGGVILTKAGPGTLTLSGINTYTGATYINGGALSITSDRNLVGANGTFANLTSSLSSPTVTSTAASIPDGFGTGTGAQMLGRRVDAISGSPGAYSITLSANALTALTDGTASWAYLPGNGSTLYINNGGRLQTSGNFALQESNSGGSAGVTTLTRAISIGSGGGGIEVLSGTLTNTGGITANGQFIKSGPGKLVSTVANTFNTGGLTVNDGTLQFITTANTFNNRVTVNGGTLQFTITGNNLYGGVTLNGGTLLLDAANTIAGGVTLNGGTLSLNNNTYVGSTPLTFAGGTLQVTGAQTDPNSLNINWANFSGGFDIANAATTFMVTNAISGSGSLVKSGSGTLALTGPNTYSGATTILNGTLQLGTNIVTGSGFESPVTGTYLYNVPTGWTSVKSTRVGVCKNTFTAIAPQEGAQAGFLQGESGGGGDISQVINVPSSGIWPLTFKAIGRSGANGPAPLAVLTNGVQAASWPATAFSKTAWTNITLNLNLSAGAHTLTFTNTATTDLSDCIDAVSLLSPAASLPTNTALTIASGAILDLCNGSLTIKDLTGAGTITNLASGRTLTVTGTNTFTGTISGSGALNVPGVISPAGPGVFGTNTVAQALTFSGTLEVDVATDGTSDQLVTQGTLDLTGATVSVVNEGGLSIGKRYVILKYNSVTGDFSDIHLPRLWMTKKDTVNKQILLVAKIGTMISFM